MLNEKEYKEISKELAKINEQLTIKNKRAETLWKVVSWIIIGIVVFNIFIFITAIINIRGTEHTIEIIEEPTILEEYISE